MTPQPCTSSSCCAWWPSRGRSGTHIAEAIGWKATPRQSKSSSQSSSCKPPSFGAANVCKPRCRARSNSRTSSSTNNIRCRPSAQESGANAPDRSCSSMMPALPSKPSALPTMGPLKKSDRPASARADVMVFSVLLEMMPKRTEASRKARSRGANTGARSASSACLRPLIAASPGVAVRVPSKSKNTAMTPPATRLKSPRNGSGVPGVMTMFLYDTDEQLDGVAKLNNPGRREL
mmetsp:Transcript_30702/g.88633  ORF Transcript_30702/g.88633 Transcript_30702/m.88633 type:complete len:234 (-) Transcript_30702:1258-1959(-)